jgi:hypothetical protein
MYLSPCASALAGRNREDTDMNAADLEIEVTFDQYSAGRHPEDGSPVIGESYFVIATAADGRRWAHVRRWNNAAVVRDVDAEFGAYVERDWEGAGEAAAEKLAERVRAAGEINLAHWDEIDPAYASVAYQRSGIEAERALMDRFAE